MIDFRSLNNPSAWFYKGKRLELNGYPPFKKLWFEQGGQMHFGSDYISDEKSVEVKSFCMGEETPFIVSGPLFEIFADLADKYAREESASGYQKAYSFVLFGELHVEVLVQIGSDHYMVESLQVPSDLKDHRQRLVQAVQEALSTLKVVLN